MQYAQINGGWVRMGVARPPLPFEAIARGTREPTLGELGAAPVVAQGVSAVAGKAAAVEGTALATYIGAGTAIAPVIGTAVGLVVGLVAGKLLNKNYLNVPAMNAAEGDEIAVFNQYRAIAGQAPGRQYGLAAMTAVWKGALHSGYFPKNNFVQCFHEGCSAHPGNASMIDDVLTRSCGDKNCFIDVLPAFNAARSSSVSGPMPTPSQQMAARNITAVNRSTLPMIRGGGPAGFKGLGRLGIVPYSPAPQTGAAPVPEAVMFIDQFFIPAQARCSASVGCGWAVPASNLEHQILYDVADAYLAQQPYTTTPYIAAKPYVQPPAAVPIPAVATVVPGTVPIPGPCTPFALGQPRPALMCAPPSSLFQEGCRTAAQCTQPVSAIPTQPISPFVTQRLPATPQPIASAAKYVTSTGSATQANLDASLAAQGFTRLGTTPQGVPIYGTSGGDSFLYSNGQLFPYGSIAQLATSGNAGTGISIPATGLDPTTAQLIANMLAQGLPPAQIAQTALAALTAQGVPITPQIQSQVNAAASGQSASSFSLASISPLMLGAGALVLLLVLRR
jgi:hypothetical protein